MPVVVVANPKGGVGKSTPFDERGGLLRQPGAPGHPGRVDPQKSAHLWLSLRPPPWPHRPVGHRCGYPGQAARGTTHAVLDTPAGLHGGALGCAQDGRQGHRAAAAQHLRHLRPQAFLDKLREHRHAAGVQVGIVGMRIDERTRSAEQLHHFVEGLGLPVLGYVRDTQNYVHLAAQGLSVFDVGATTRVARDLEQWQSICQWLDA